MCGRYSTTMDPQTLYGVFEALPDLGGGEHNTALTAPPGSGEYGGDVPRPRFNIAPTTDNPVVRIRRDQSARSGSAAPSGSGGSAAGGPAQPTRGIELLRWGLVPSWAKDPSIGNRLFNARAESAADKPAFRRAVQRRRCLVPASGWFEWQKLAGGNAKRPAKQAFYLTPQDGSVLAFAGLWEYWRPSARGAAGEAASASADTGAGSTAGADTSMAAGLAPPSQHSDPDDQAGDWAPPIVSYTILTTASVGGLRGIHERMPLVLPASDWAAWLDPEREDVGELLVPPDQTLVAQLELRPIGARVGNVRFDDASLLERVDPAPGAVGGPDADRTEPAESEPMLPLG